MLKINKLLIIAVASASCAAASAQNYIDSLAERLLENNLQLNYLSHSIKAESASLRDAVMPQAPEIEVEHLFGEKGVKNKTGVSISQNFDWPGAIRARRRAASAGTEAGRLRMAAARRDKLLEAKLLMLDIVYARRRAALLDSTYNNISAMTDFTEKAYRNGELTILDVNRLKLRRLDLRSQQSAAAISLSSLRASLVSLAGTEEIDDCWDALTRFPEEALRTEEKYAEAIENSDPEVNAARARIQLLEEQAKATRLARYPGFSVGYKYSREEGHDFHGFSVGMSLPFLRKNYAGQAAAEERLAAEFSLQEVRIGRLAQMYALHAELERLTADANEYRSVFEGSDHLRLLGMAYRGGEISAIEYLTDINYFMEAQFAAEDLGYRRATALARINSLLP